MRRGSILRAPSSASRFSAPLSIAAATPRSVACLPRDRPAARISLSGQREQALWTRQDRTRPAGDPRSRPRWRRKAADRRSRGQVPQSPSASAQAADCRRWHVRGRDAGRPGQRRQPLPDIGHRSEWSARQPYRSEAPLNRVYLDNLAGLKVASAMVLPRIKSLGDRGHAAGRFQAGGSLRPDRKPCRGARRGAAARERAEAADKAKSELLAVVSHELRTPMGALISMSELLLISQLDATQRRYAETLRAIRTRPALGAERDSRFHQPRSRKLELAIAPFDLHDLVKTLNGTLRAKAEEKACKAASISA